MIVILTHPDDGAALWLDGALRHLGVSPIELVSVEQLVFSRRIVHRMTDSGDRSAIHLADGRVLRSEAITGLINRVRYVPTQHFANTAPDDRTYAAAELNAFVLAWVHGIAGRVLNPPRPLALDNGTFSRPSLLHFAAMAGLPTTRWRACTCAGGADDGASLALTHSVVVLDGRIYGPVIPRTLQEACLRLAVLLGVPMLQVFLHRSQDHGWRFVDASGRVDFRAGGRPLAIAVAKALEGVDPRT